MDMLRRKRKPSTPTSIIAMEKMKDITARRMVTRK
jgi:hypothetical protein